MYGVIYVWYGVTRFSTEPPRQIWANIFSFLPISDVGVLCHTRYGPLCIRLISVCMGMNVYVMHVLCNVRMYVMYLYSKYMKGYAGLNEVWRALALREFKDKPEMYFHSLHAFSVCMYVCMY